MNMESISGLLVGKNENEIVVVNSHDKSYVRTLRIRGHWLYCRKVEREGTNGPIVLCDKSKKDHSLLTVLAIGDKVETELSRLKVGNVISTPWDDPIWIERSPYNADEYFIGESIAQLASNQEIQPCQT